jgi:protein-arginine kinase activator protein McsA
MYSLIKSIDNWLDFWNIEPTDPRKIFGSKEHKRTEESGESEDYKWTSEEWTSEDGKTKFYRKVMTSKAKPEKRNLQKELDLAIREQRFEDAIKLRDEIKKEKAG